MNARVADPVAEVRAITGGRGADCVLEAAGNEASFRSSPRPAAWAERSSGSARWA